MRRPSRRAIALLLALFIVGGSSSRAAHAEPTPEDLARAKELFQQGNDLRNAGDCERALERFAASRALVPSVPNILNTAFCLNVLGRADEALDEYAILITGYKDQLSAEELDQLTQTMTGLRDKVGGIEVVANVEGATLVVDTRSRGTLPRVAPVRILPGEHRVLVVKDGYEAFDTTARVDAGRVTQVRATLRPISIAGRVRIDAAELAGAEVIVDGAPIGKVPWEGTLSRGTHWIALSLGDRGTAPARVVVVDGQTAVIAPPLLPLGQPLDIVTLPPDARLSIDDVELGAGRFRMRLPRGDHRLAARAEGYRTLERKLRIDPGTPSALRLELAIDPEHPRWAAAGDPLHYALEIHGGLLVGPELDSGAEQFCDERPPSCSASPLLGGNIELRAAILFPFGLSLGVAGGYMGAGMSLSRSVGVAFEPFVEYQYEDDLGILGPYAALRVGYTFTFGIVEPRLGVSGGVLFASARDRITVTATANGETARAFVENAGESASRVDVFVRPELGVGLRAGPVRFGVDVGASVFLLEGPTNTNGSTIVADSDRCLRSSPNVYCTPFQDLVAEEYAYGPFVVFSPTASVGYVF